MSERLRPSMFAVALLSLLTTTSAIGQQPESCGIKDLKGAYGFSIKGKNTAVNVDYILTGRFDADGSGSFNGSGQQSISGQASTTTFNGTYDVNPDCTGRARFVYADGTIADLFFVIVQDGAEVLILDSDTGTLESGSAKKVRLGKEKI